MRKIIDILVLRSIKHGCLRMDDIINELYPEIEISFNTNILSSVLDSLLKDNLIDSKTIIIKNTTL